MRCVAADHELAISAVHSKDAVVDVRVQLARTIALRKRCFPGADGEYEPNRYGGSVWFFRKMAEVDYFRFCWTLREEIRADTTKWLLTWESPLTWLRADAIMVGQSRRRDFRFRPMVCKGTPEDDFVRQTRSARQFSFRCGYVIDYHNIEAYHFDVATWPVRYARPRGEFGLIEATYGMNGTPRSPVLTYSASDLVQRSYSDAALAEAQSSPLWITVCSDQVVLIWAMWLRHLYCSARM